MAGKGNDTTGGSGNDTLAGASFALTVPGPGTPPSPTFSDLTRLGAVDSTDEPSLPVDPDAPTGKTFAGDSAGSPFADGALSYSTGTIHFVAPCGYLRLGAPSNYEWWLTSDPTGTAGPTKPANLIKLQSPDTDDDASPLGGTGVLLHSNQQVTLFAPNLNEVTNKRLSVTWASPNRIGILSGQDQDAAGTMTNSQYQVADNFSSMIGNSVSTIGGSAATIWTGSDASTGFGSLLWSNFGLTQNLFFGQIVNITNCDVEVQGFGSTKFSDSDVYAPDHIAFRVAPVSDAVGLAAKLATVFAVAGTVGMALTAALTLAMEIETGVASDNAYNNPDALMKVLNDYRDQMYDITALSAATEILAIAAGLALGASAKISDAAVASSIIMNDNSITLKAGGTSVTIGTNGFTVNAGDPTAITTAVANMTAVNLDQQAVDLYFGLFLKLASDPATAGFDAFEALQAASEQVANNIPVPGVPGIALNSYSSLKSSAPSIQFNIPAV